MHKPAVLSSSSTKKSDSGACLGQEGMFNVASVLPVIVVNLGITLGSELLLIPEGSDGFHTSQALAEMGVHRRSGGGITPLQLHIRAAVVLLEEEVYYHKRYHTFRDTQTVSKVTLPRAVVVMWN